MTWRAVVWTMLAVAGVVGLVAGLGWDERRHEAAEMDALLRGEAPPEAQAGLLERLLIGEQRPGTSYSVGISFNPATGAWRAGERSWRGEPMAKTQVATEEVISCTVEIFGVQPAQTLHPANYIYISSGVGTIMFNANGVTTVGGVVNYVFEVEIDPAEPTTHMGTIYVPADGELHSFPVSISYPLVLTTARADDPIGDKAAATHAKERVATDAWVVPEGGTWSASGAGGTVEWTWAGVVNRRVDISSHIIVDSTQGHYEGEMDYFRVSSIAINGTPIDASLCNEEFEPFITGGSNTPENVWLRGSGATIRCMQDDYIGTSLTGVHATATPPIVHSFSGLHVTDMDGADLSDLVLWFTGAQWYNANTEEWEYRGYTLAEWQALTLVPDWGIYSWDESPPPDGALRTLATAGFYIDRDSARTHQLDGFAEPEEA